MDLIIGSIKDIKQILPLTKVLMKLHIASEPSIFRRFSKRKATRYFEKKFDRGVAALLMAREGKKTTGYAFVVEHTERKGTFSHERRFIVLEQIVVAPDFQRQGIGRALIARSKEMANQKGYSQLELGVWCFNEFARNLFVSCGFSDVMMTMRSQTTPT